MNVTGTDAAARVVERAKHDRRGSLVFTIGTGCCESTAPFLYEDFWPGPDAEQVGEVGGVAVFAPLALAMLIGSMFLITRVISKLGGAQRRIAAPWLCGYVREADCHRYTAHNFYGEIKRWFRWLGGAPNPVPGKQDDVKGPSS